MTDYRELDRGDIVRTLLGVGAILLLWTGAIVLAIVLLRDRMALALTAVGVLTAILLVGMFRWHAKSFAYRCPKCDHVFTLTVAQDFLSPNLGTRKLVTCPACQESVEAKGLRILKGETGP